MINHKTTALDNLTTDEKQVIAAILLSDTLQFEIGAMNWNLTDEQEGILWDLINRVEASQ